MKQTIGLYEFRDGFEQLRPDNFSYEGLECLFDYFEELEDDIGEYIPFDVIAFCCEYTEYQLDDYLSDYSLDKDLTMQEAIEHAQRQTQVIPVDEDTLIIGVY